MRVSKRELAPSREGFVVLDASGRVLSCNQEAIRILTYPENGHDNGRRPYTNLSAKLLLRAIRNGASERLEVAPEVISGRRKYHCQAFAVDNFGSKAARSQVAVILRRDYSRRTAVMDMAVRFNLTDRERQVLERLSEGLTTRAIAAQMELSPNTIKSFLRLIMTKVGVSTRSGIISKL
jgi:DNA-binding CsgD family transcriptional regulator